MVVVVFHSDGVATEEIEDEEIPEEVDADVDAILEEEETGEPPRDAPFLSGGTVRILFPKYLLLLFFFCWSCLFNFFVLVVASSLRIKDTIFFSFFVLFHISWAMEKSHSRCFVAVHIGAGKYSSANEHLYVEIMKQACKVGLASLRIGTALDAVESAIAFLEDSPFTNAGFNIKVLFFFAIAFFELKLSVRKELVPT
jgi:hypothetical protein